MRNGCDGGGQRCKVMASGAAPQLAHRTAGEGRDSGDLRGGDPGFDGCPEGLHAFFRGYFHYKSADWVDNRPYRLQAWTAAELAKMPTYYIMDLHKNMGETVAAEMPTPAQIAACRWLPESELAVYSAEYGRTGFQGGLQWYRRGTQGIDTAELQLFSGRTIDVPSIFIAGKQDWGTYQRPGNFERMQQSACIRMLGCHLIDGAGHWVQQEQPERVSELMIDFLQRQ